MSESVVANSFDEDYEIHFNIEEISDIEDLDENIVFIFYNDNLVMVFDSKKKVWEFPSGKKEENETHLECVKREAFKKTGAILESAFPIGYYIDKRDKPITKKAIYFGKAARFEPRNEWGEVDLVKLFDELPQELREKNIYSIILDYIRSQKSS